jgi:hypothetical protein
MGNSRDCPLPDVRVRGSRRRAHQPVPVYDGCEPSLEVEHPRTLYRLGLSARTCPGDGATSVTGLAMREEQLSTADADGIGFVEFDDESFSVELKAQVVRTRHG